MAVIQDAFEHGRIPLRPLAYKLKELVQCNELIIDYSGEDAKYHIYIASEDDPTILIDITQKIIDEVFNNSEINVDNFQVLLDGIDTPINLKDLLNEIYKKIIYPESLDFNSDEYYKLFEGNAHNILFKDDRNNYLLPMTTIYNVYDSNGNNLADRLGEGMPRISFSSVSIKATTNNQTTFTFTYPCINYSGFIDVRIGSVYIDKTRYSIVNNMNEDNNYSTATLTFIDDTKIEKDRKIDIFFIYDSISASKSNNIVDGASIANKSISIDKLYKTSDLIRNDPSSIATSAAVYSLFNILAMTAETNNIFWSIDDNITSYLKCKINENINQSAIITITIINKKTDLSKIVITKDNTDKEYPLKLINSDENITSVIPAGRTIRIIIDDTNNKAYLISDNIYSLQKTRYVYTCTEDGGFDVSYAGLNYEATSIIDVYRNGVKLFEGIDYHRNIYAEKIVLYVRKNEGERFVFEALTN